MVRFIKAKSNYFILVFLFGFLVFSCSNKKESLKIGQTAPDFTLQTINGQTIELSNYKGKAILLHFWADWCTECRAEFPELQKAQETIIDESIVIIAVNVGQEKSHVQSFVDNYKLTFPMLMDPQMSVAQRYAVHGLPTSFLINKNFILQKMHIGWLDVPLIQQLKEAVQ